MLGTNLLSSCSNSAPFTPVIDEQMEMANNNARMKFVIPPFLLIITNDVDDAWRLLDTGGPLPSPLSVASRVRRVRFLLFIGSNFV